MGLDIIFKEDIHNALLAADEASSATARVCAAVDGDGSPLLRAYLEGYRAALTTVALAFGLSPAIIKYPCGFSNHRDLIVVNPLAEREGG